MAGHVRLLVSSAYLPWDPWVGQLLGEGRPLPLVARLAALGGDSLWAVGLALAITLPLLLLPAGRPRSRRWRTVLVACIAGTTLEVAAWWLSPGPMTQTVRPLAARLRDQVDLDALHGELLAVVDQTMQPTRAFLWLRPTH